MQRVVGIGGIFLRARNPEKLKNWYIRHLGFPVTPDGYVVFVTNDNERAHTVWSTFPEETDYFSPSRKECMFNYRVANLEKLLEVLREEGVEIVDEIQKESYGKFGWIMDPEGNKIELWEPVPEEFNRINKLS